jgi:hypothetical protein
MEYNHLIVVYKPKWNKYILMNNYLNKLTKKRIFSAIILPLIWNKIKIK